MEGIDFVAESGEITAITGPSGSGKTTLLRCIMGITQPDRGEIGLNGETYSQRDNESRRKFRLHNIGVVDQASQLLEDLTCAENFQLIAEMSGTNGRDSRHKAEEILGQLGMAKHAKRYPGSLSGGERQRISVACALANNPSLIAADEPTSSLDDESAADVLELFTELAHNFAVPVVIVTHDSRVTCIANRNVRMGKKCI
ncbi:ABC-type antimicrobial peptide transport system, ATPase component [Corynebacterium camporealensis]|uniref:ABC-type antimicrobial peptide transport system, ATPase component n=1 Tax=Corynebacterium camporealensis TaxID=161896 RepID=A0A0F6TBY6_9CORY|nr:ABC-type antimicrobial peptide transport system, ATPase component [Corynebacterium camporealensis]